MAWSDEIPVGTPITIPLDLVDGVYRILVIGKAPAGNWQATALTSSNWTLDTTAPTAVIGSPPASLTNLTSFSIAITGAGVTQYKYALNGGAYSQPSSISSRIALSGLADGAYSLDVVGRDAVGNWQTTPTTYSWVVDTTAAVAVLSNTPQPVTQETSATISVDGTDVVAYMYKLNGGAWSASTPVATPIALANLTEGTYSLSVKSVDAAGNWQVAPTTYSWVVDTTAPIAVLSNAPQPVTAATSATIYVGDDVVAYMYKLNGGAWSTSTPVATPITLSNLTEGAYTLDVVGRDAAGNWQVAPTTYSWVVDTTAPIAVLSGVPQPLFLTIDVSHAHIYVGGTDVVAYMYKLNGGAWSTSTPVATPIGVDLYHGAYSLEVVGCDAVGNWQTTPTTYSWVVDKPLFAVLSGAPEEHTKETSATIYVGGDDVVAYMYRLNAGLWSASTPVATPITLSNLTEGAYTLDVKGLNPESSLPTWNRLHYWVVDTTAPTAVIWSPPASLTNLTSFSINITGAGVTQYKYALNGGAYSQPISISSHIALSGLADGAYSLEVVGCDAAGNWQTTPTTASWTVDATAPIAVLSNAPQPVTAATSATISVGGTDVVGYAYRLNGGAWSNYVPVATPITLSNLAKGAYSLYVAGHDAAGNWQVAPTTYSWVVDEALTAVLGGSVPSGVYTQYVQGISVGGYGVTHYKYSLNGGAYTDEAPISAAIDLPMLPDGEYTLDVIGRGLAGNWLGTPTHAAWSLLIPPPVATVSGILNPSLSTVNASIGGARVAAFNYKLDQMTTIGPVVASGYGLSLNIEPNGPHQLSVWGIDLAGRVQTTPTVVEWTVDSAQPVFNLVYDAGGANGTVPFDNKWYFMNSKVYLASASTLNYPSKKFNSWFMSDYGSRNPGEYIMTPTAAPQGGHIIFCQAQWTIFNWYAANSSILYITGVVNNVPQSGTVTIPYSLGHQAVTVIGNNCFKDMSAISSVVLNCTSLSEIQSQAFAGCSGMTSITTPNSLTRLGVSAFEGCSSLTAFTIPVDLTVIQNRAFYGCSSISSINIGATNVSLVGEAAFQGCASLSDLSFGTTLQVVGANAFTGTGITHAHFKGNAPSIQSTSYPAGTVLHYVPGKTGWTNPMAGFTTVGDETPY